MKLCKEINNYNKRINSPKIKLINYNQKSNNMFKKLISKNNL